MLFAEKEVTCCSMQGAAKHGKECRQAASPSSDTKSVQRTKKGTYMLVTGLGTCRIFSID